MATDESGSEVQISNDIRRAPCENHQTVKRTETRGWVFLDDEPEDCASTSNLYKAGEDRSIDETCRSVSAGYSWKTTRLESTYDGVQDVQCRQALGEQGRDPHARIQVHLAQAITQGHRSGSAEDKGPEQGRDGIVTDEVGPLGEFALKDGHSSNRLTVDAYDIGH